AETTEETKCNPEEYSRVNCSCHLSGFEEFLKESNSTCLLRDISGPKTWDQARATCQYEYGGDLVRLDNVVLELVVITWLRKTNGRFHIGLHARKKRGEFRWLDDVVKPHRINWEHGEPRRGRLCASLKITSGTLISVNCDQTSSYICQVASGKVQLCYPIGSRR
ncbi:hypothetical protein RRG08_002125, partial [Elysia crispata]